MKRKLALIIIIILGTMKLGYSQWQQIKGPYGGSINTLKVHKQILFAATDGGLYSTITGDSWSLVETPFRNASVTSLSDNDSVLYAATRMGLYSTSDAGMKWNKIEFGESSSSAVYLIFSLNNILFITYQNASGLDSYVPKYSLDKGLSWLKSSGLHNVADMIYDGKNFYLTDGYTNLPAVVSRSADGINWVKDTLKKGLNGQISNLLFTNKRIFASGSYIPLCTKDSSANWVEGAQAFQSLIANKDTIYAGTQQGILYSTSNGNFWTPLSNPLPFYCKPTVIYKNKIYAIGREQIFAFDKALKTWTTSSNGISAYSFRDMICFKNSIIGTSSSGTFIGKSFNEFIKVNSTSTFQLAKSDSILFAQTIDSLCFFDESNNKWIGRKKFYQETSIDYNNNSLYVCSGDEFYKSIDGGENLITQNSGNVNLFQRLTFKIFKSGSIFYKIKSQEVYFSNDEGKNWTGPSLTFGKFYSSTEINGTAFISCSLGLVSSTDGSTWGKTPNNLPTTDNLVVTAYNNIMYGGLNGAIYYSVDFGRNWKIISSGLPNTNIKKIVVSGDYIYAGTYNAGVWKYNISNLQNVTTSFIRTIDNEPTLKVYPNPANDKLFVETNSSNLSIAVLNVTGQKVLELHLSENSNVVNIDHLKEGIYFCKLLGEKTNTVEKLIISRH